MSRRKSVAQQRRLQFEEFEKRLVMSAQAVGSLLPELEIAAPAITQQEVTLEHAHSDAASIADQYGFDGAGQTIAVIDSGIAWDHYALGGAFGEDARVVGGWDFAENDAIPYDDGPAGFHGTHVAGIIGSSDDQFRGVSSGVDLVALRVFSDRGESSLEWVEQALQWVHENKDAFDNPITTVNLSLGTGWNSENLPDWAILEEEFAQLEADGLFISVAAGNDFRSYNEAGLSYPAVSDHVVPVASHDANGQISEFSQRDDGVLVAPGELLRSTAPDHLFGGASTGQFVGSTGTSMAAPYVAGASAILRQANEFMGIDNVTQDMLYEQFRDTADRIYDAITGQYHYRVNLEAALAHVVVDIHGDTGESSTQLGTVLGNESIEGTIGKLTDVDTFQMTANHTGKLTLAVGVTDDLIPLIDVVGTDATIVNNEITFDVVAGMQYEFAIATVDGNGQYRINTTYSQISDTLPSSDDQTANDPDPGDVTHETQDWGRVVTRHIVDQAIIGESTFELTSARDGIVTIQASTSETDRPLTIEVFDGNANLIDASTSSDGSFRFDLQALGGERFTIKATGNHNSVDFRVDNLVTLKDGHLVINGTNKNDEITFSSGHDIEVDVNGVSYSFSRSDVQDIFVYEHAGEDHLDVILGSDNDTVSTRVDGVNVFNDDFRLLAYGVSNVNVDGGGGYDVVSMLDSVGNDQFVSGVQNEIAWASLSGDGFHSQVNGFDVIYSLASNGTDSATLNGTSGNDLFVSKQDRNTIWVGDATVLVDDFESIVVDGRGGHDTANVYDSYGDDSFTLAPESSRMDSESYTVNWLDFERTNAFSNSGSDSILMLDSAGNDTFYSANGMNVLSGDGFINYAEGFANVRAVATTGFDFGQIIDTVGNDWFSSDGGSTKMISANATIETDGFKTVNLVSRNGGFDQAAMRGTNGVDVLTADKDSIHLANSNGQSNRVIGMDETQVDLAGGDDIAYLIGSSDKELLSAGYDEVEFETTLQLLQLRNAENTEFDGNGGGDEVNFHGFGDLDLLESIGDKAVAYLQDHKITVEEFDLLQARAVDDAIADYDMEAVEYLYLLRGQWLKK